MHLAWRLHATERSNEVRKALANPDMNARQETLVSLFYTPSWGHEPSRSRLLGDPSMAAADRQRHLR
jgi:3-oxoadipate enol-lactonase